MMITKVPTKIIIGLRFTLLTKIAPSGEAIVPPTINPNTTCHEFTPSKSKKVIPLANETANSAAFTDPIV